MHRQSTEDLSGSGVTLCGTRAAPCHYTFVQSHRMDNPRGNSNVNYGLGVIMMCPRRFIKL